MIVRQCRKLGDREIQDKMGEAFFKDQDDDLQYVDPVARRKKAPTPHPLLKRQYRW